MKHGWIQLTLLGCALTLVAGCATGRTSVGSAASDAVGADQGAAGSSCTADFAGPSAQAPSEHAVPLPADFVAVAASRCQYTVRAVPGDGEYAFRLEQRVDGGLTDLVHQLRQPNQPAKAGMACDLMLVAPVIITLIDAQGTSLVPVVPQTDCGRAQPAVVTAIQALPWRTVNEIRLRQTRTELETSTGCSSGYKPVIDIEAAFGTPTAGAGLSFPTPPTVLQVCHYELDPTGTITAGSQTFRVGKLTGAADLTGAPLIAFLTALAAAKPVAAPCVAAQAPFAVVSGKGGGSPWFVVELGGCHRFDDGTGIVRQLDATVSLPTG
jgi:hypothetical protein